MTLRQHFRSRWLTRRGRASTAPFSRLFGLERGRPIDRYYIERFLDENRHAIRGRVLEVGDRTYTVAYGGDRVTVTDILNIRDVPPANIIADLQHAPELEDDSFDCVILTQVLQLTYDTKSVIATLHRILKPGGVLLVTASTISQKELGSTWYSSLYPAALRRLLTAHFAERNVVVSGYGNVLAATWFLYGLAVEEVDASLLEERDDQYVMGAVAVAVKTNDSCWSAVQPLAVDVHQISSVGLHANIESPASGDSAGPRWRLSGWVVPDTGHVSAIEVVSGEALLARIAIGVERPDVARSLLEEHADCVVGFDASLVVPLARSSKIEVLAILPDHRRIELASISLTRRENPAVPKVSIVIPCYRQAHFLGAALESAVSQTYPNIEVIVVDDGSTDNVAAVAARYPGCIYLRRENGGLAAARNSGFRASGGDYVVFLDADDTLTDDAVSRGVDALLNAPQAAFAYGHYRFILYDGAVRNEWSQHPFAVDHYEQLLRGNFIGMHATVIYQRWALEVESFDEMLPRCEDYDVYLRLARRFPIVGHGVTVANYRMHGRNMSADDGRMLRSALDVLKKQKSSLRNERERHAWREGVVRWREWYAPRMLAAALAAAYAGQWRSSASLMTALAFAHRPTFRRGLAMLKGVRPIRRLASR